jgi:hypothetical protein
MEFHHQSESCTFPRTMSRLKHIAGSPVLVSPRELRDLCIELDHVYPPPSASTIVTHRAREDAVHCRFDSHFLGKPGAGVAALAAGPHDRFLRELSHLRSTDGWPHTISALSKTARGVLANQVHAWISVLHQANAAESPVRLPHPPSMAKVIVEGHQLWP